MAEDKNKTAGAEAANAEEVKAAEAEAKAKADKEAADKKAADDKAAADKADADAKKAEKAKKFIVASEFRDVSNFDKVHKVGDDVSLFDKARLDSLVNRGLVKKS